MLPLEVFGLNFNIFLSVKCLSIIYVSPHNSMVLFLAKGSTPGSRDGKLLIPVPLLISLIDSIPFRFSLVYGITYITHGFVCINSLMYNMH